MKVIQCKKLLINNYKYQNTYKITVSFEKGNVRMTYWVEFGLVRCIILQGVVTHINSYRVFFREVYHLCLDSTPNGSKELKSNLP